MYHTQLLPAILNPYNAPYGVSPQVVGGEMVRGLQYLENG
jgi:hypothetical protein